MFLFWLRVAAPRHPGYSAITKATSCTHTGSVSGPRATSLATPKSAVNIDIFITSRFKCYVSVLATCSTPRQLPYLAGFSAIPKAPLCTNTERESGSLSAHLATPKSATYIHWLLNKNRGLLSLLSHSTIKNFSLG